MADPDLHAAWAEVHDNTPEGWSVGRPGCDERRERHRRWSMYAFDTSEKPVVGKRANEWTVTEHSELHCVQEMARCLGELKAGRWPE